METLGGSPSKRGGSEHTLLYLTLFVVAVLISTSLLLIAAVLCLSDLLGSLLYALLIIAALSASVAFVIYHVQLSPLFRSVREQLQTIYEVSALAQIGYNWVNSKIDNMLQRFMRL